MRNAGEKAYLLADQQEVWELEGYYIAEALVQYILILSPEKIILGRGVMKQHQLFSYIRQHVKKRLNQYIDLPDIEHFIVPLN